METKLSAYLQMQKKFRQVIEIVNAIKHFESKKSIFLNSANGHGKLFPKLEQKFLHQADICQRAIERLSKRLLILNP